jgi:hypothetical protein
MPPRSTGPSSAARRTARPGTGLSIASRGKRASRQRHPRRSQGTRLSSPAEEWVGFRLTQAKRKSGRCRRARSSLVRSGRIPCGQQDARNRARAQPAIPRFAQRPVALLARIKCPGTTSNAIVATTSRWRGNRCLPARRRRRTRRSQPQPAVRAIDGWTSWLWSCQSWFGIGSSPHASSSQPFASATAATCSQLGSSSDGGGSVRRSAGTLMPLTRFSNPPGVQMNSIRQPSSPIE